MATLKQIATQVMDVLDVPYNQALSIDIQHHIVNLRNLYVSRTLNKGRHDERYVQHYDVNMELSVEGDDISSSKLGAESGVLKLLISTNKIPVTVNYNKSAPFISLYIKERKLLIKEAMFVNYSLLHDYFTTRFTKGTIIYSIKDSKIVLLSTLNIKDITVADVFENPLIVIGEYGTFNIGGIVFNENVEFPVDSSIIGVIVSDVVKLFNGNAKDNIPEEN